MIGNRIHETGTLVRDGGALILRRDLGGRYQLELQRTPLDLVEKRVRVRERWSEQRSPVSTV